MAQQVAVSHDVSKLVDKIKDVTYATLTTLTAQGKPHGRPMYTCEASDEQALWFFSEKAAQKISEIQHNPHVGLGYSDPDKDLYVTVTGTASIVSNPEKIKDLWREDFRGFFPKGSDDPNLTLIRVDIESGEYWDEPSSKLLRAFTYVKAVTTGEKHQPTPEEQSKIQA